MYDTILHFGDQNDAGADTTQAVSVHYWCLVKTFM